MSHADQLHSHPRIVIISRKLSKSIIFCHSFSRRCIGKGKYKTKCFINGTWHPVYKHYHYLLLRSRASEPCSLAIKVRLLNAHAPCLTVSGTRTRSSKPSIGIVFTGDKDPSIQRARARHFCLFATVVFETMYVDDKGPSSQRLYFRTRSIGTVFTAQCYRIDPSTDRT
jgi:hypothetical protein